MAALSNHAQAISQIMSVISDIAVQTTFLRSMPLLRRLEPEKPFAVVADDVRKLAEKAMTSTIDVGNAIRF